MPFLINEILRNMSDRAEFELWYLALSIFLFVSGIEWFSKTVTFLSNLLSNFLKASKIMVFLKSDIFLSYLLKASNTVWFQKTDTSPKYFLNWRWKQKNLKSDSKIKAEFDRSRIGFWEWKRTMWMLSSKIRITMSNTLTLRANNLWSTMELEAA